MSKTAYYCKWKGIGGMSHYLEHKNITTNDINLHIVQSGSKNGMLVILLHGFPEFWRAWSKQISALADAGYWVWAPDQRGYNLSHKPESITAYALDQLTADIVGLIDAAGREKAIIIGHDWGATVSWWVSLRHSSRVEKLVILNLPHPKVMVNFIRHNPKQMLKSWYIFFFQIPGLAAFIARINNYQLFVWTLRSTSRPGTFSEQDMEAYRRAWSQPGAFSAMLKWYRAYVRHPPKRPESMRVKIPTLIIWGGRDTFLSREMVQPSIELCDNGHLVLIEEATHWVQHEEADLVNELIITFLRDQLPMQS
jgi:pimeloyl-ACP methyl ester carboxylesterase